MFTCDYHTHTYLSFDGDGKCSPDALCAAAIEKGVTDLAITDHFECNWCDVEEHKPFDTERAYREIMAAKEKYAGRLDLTYGIELGQANQYPDEARRVLAEHKYEFVLCSMHNITNQPDFSYMDFKDPERQAHIGEMFDKSIDELCQVIDTFDRIDSIAHLTYMKRYSALAGLKYDYTQHFNTVEALFKKMIAHDIAIEVNVSTLWKGLGFSMVDKDFLGLYRDLGGRLITIGTDSHNTVNVGRCVKDGFAIIKSCGFDSVMTVKDGHKILNKI